MTMIHPRRGQMVLYSLSASDVSEIGRVKEARGGQSNSCREGDVIPFLIVQPWSHELLIPVDASINGQGFIDGDFTIWLTSRHQSDEPAPGCWHHA